MWFLTVAATDYGEDYMFVVHDKMQYNNLLKDYDDVHDLDEYKSDLPDEWADDILTSIHNKLKSLRNGSTAGLPLYRLLDFPTVTSIINEYFKSINEFYEEL